jgi:ABC-type Fe3+-hydroxamate transport system substrate-binding protein
MRVVSLLPSATESLVAIGGESFLVGRSHECDFPVSIIDRPALTAQKRQASQTSSPTSSPAEIDRQVRESLAAGQSLYDLDIKKLAELSPDVILTQDLCEVCSVDLAAVRRAAAQLPRAPEIVSLNPQTVEDVLEDLIRIGQAVGLEASAADVAGRLRERMYQAIEHVNPFTDGPSVAFLEWTDPIFIGGHWTPQLIERAGGIHPLNPTTPVEGSGAAVGMQLAYRKAGKSIRVPSEIVAASRPDAVIICPCGVGLAETRRMAEALSQEPWWQSLPAVKAGRVALVDGNQYFNRPGPRLVEALEFLVGWLNGVPGVIPEGFAWERF